MPIGIEESSNVAPKAEEADKKMLQLLETIRLNSNSQNL